ncbi:MAG: hypothetical protein RJA44_531 [Pseudomonadota bacterium]
MSPRTWFHRLPFRLKLAMMSAASALLALTLLAVLTGALIWWAAGESARYQGMALRPLLSAALTPAMIEHDYAGAQEIARSILSRDGIIDVTVQNAGGRSVVYERASPASHRPLLVYSETVDLQESGLPFGSITVSYTPGPTIALLHGLIWAVLASALGAVLMALWVFKGWARRISRHLEHLSASARQLAEGDLGARAEPGMPDEVGQLAGSFNHMAERLQQQFEALGRAEQLQRRLAEAEREQHGRLEALFGALTEGIVFTDTRDVILHVNPAFRQIWQLTLDPELNLDRLGELRRHSQLHANPTPPIDQGSPTGAGVLQELTRSDGREITETRLPVQPDGVLIGHLWIYEDVTEQRRAMRDIAWLAERDPLTGLYNRRAFEQELERRLQERARRGGRLALMYIDLDEFKELNDSLGHAAGDAMLTRLANELSTVVRHDEFIARLGGDEFGLISWVEDDSDALHMAQRVHDTIRRITVVIDSHTLRLTSSAGLALAPDHATLAGELATAADTAMYRAKASGRNAVRLYEPESGHDVGEQSLSRLDWNLRLHRALEQQRFELHFQGVWTPQRRLSHAEVLLRLRDEQLPGTLILPGQFITHAERSGLVRDIDRWVFKRSVEIMAAHASLHLGVNVSGCTVAAGGFPDYAAEVLHQHQVDPARLIIEITETAAVGDLVDARRFMAEMRQLGCQLAMDDFGAGYSSFTYLRHLRTDLVKIDGQFVRGIEHERESQIFVRAIAEAVQLVNGATIAEFVESAAAARLLPELGVTLMQGYWFDRPAPLDEFLRTAAAAGGCQHRGGAQA